MTTHPLVRLALQTIETYLKEKKIIAPPPELVEQFKEKAGVFVSLKKNHELRGCIGTFIPTCLNIAEEVTRNAIEAAFKDPRFPPVRMDEVSELEVSVDVLTVPLLVKSSAELDAKKYGIIDDIVKRKA